MAADRRRHKQRARSGLLPWYQNLFGHIRLVSWDLLTFTAMQRAKMLSLSKSKTLLGLTAASLLLAACGTSIAETCQARGLDTGTPEYRECLAEERAELRQRLGGIGGGPPGGGR